MTNNYKQQITERIKDSVNRWIEELKVSHPELLLTKQWRTLFPRGFTEGNNVIPVVTGSKKGKHLVAEVQFVLPESLELDLDAMELTLKNEPFKEKEKEVSTVPIDEPLDVLNELIVGVNDFLQSLNLSLPHLTAPQTLNQATLFPTSYPFSKQQPSGGFGNIKAGPLREVDQKAVLPLVNGDDTNLIENVKKEMLKSPYLPTWFKTLESRDIWDDLSQKLAEGFVHYQRKLGQPVDLKDFFEKYTDHLQKLGKLHDYCTYKGKPVKLDYNNDRLCLESYCSRKPPYGTECPLTTPRFGPAPNDNN